MPEFTREQHQFLDALDRKYLSYLSALHHVVEEYGYRVAAISNVLFRKGLSTPEELQAAEDEIRAAVMVEQAVNPEVREAQEAVRRVVEGT